VSGGRGTIFSLKSHDDYDGCNALLARVGEISGRIMDYEIKKY
jgi:hypothetical protein